MLIISFGTLHALACKGFWRVLSISGSHRHIHIFSSLRIKIRDNYLGTYNGQSRLTCACSISAHFTVHRHMHMCLFNAACRYCRPASCIVPTQARNRVSSRKGMATSGSRYLGPQWVSPPPACQYQQQQGEKGVNSRWRFVAWEQRRRTTRADCYHCCKPSSVALSEIHAIRLLLPYHSQPQSLEAWKPSNYQLQRYLVGN